MEAEQQAPRLALVSLAHPPVFCHSVDLDQGELQ